MKSNMVRDFTEDLVDEVIGLYKPVPMTKFFFMQAGGAVARVGETDTAFPHRQSHSNMMHWNMWTEVETPEQRAERVADVRNTWKQLESYTQGYYVNLNDEDNARTHANYGPNYSRLVKVKNRYDPTNLMRLNANIEPTV